MAPKKAWIRARGSLLHFPAGMSGRTPAPGEPYSSGIQTGIMSGRTAPQGEPYSSGTQMGIMSGRTPRPQESLIAQAPRWGFFWSWFGQTARGAGKTRIYTYSQIALPPHPTPLPPTAPCPDSCRQRRPQGPAVQSQTHPRRWCAGRSSGGSSGLRKSQAAQGSVDEEVQM